MEVRGPVLVTGATGFVGSHLIDALHGRGVPVRALVRRTSDVAHLAARGVERLEGTLDDSASLARAMEGVSVVIHLAAATRARSEAEYERVNREGTRLLVETLLAAGGRPRRLVYLSSLAAVGPSDGGRPVARDETPRPLTAYGRSKLGGELACLEAGGSVEVVVLRAPAVYGPRDRDLFTFFRFAARGILPVPTGPDRPIQLVHVADLAEALVLGATSPGAAGVYHAADPRPYTWLEVARLIGEAVGVRARVVRVPGPAVRAAAAATEAAAALVGRASIFNRDKARELLAPGWLCETETAFRDFGFRARIPLAQGLADTAAWYRAQGWL